MSVDHKDPFSRVHEVKLGTRCGLSCVYTPEFGSAVTCGVGGDYRLLTGYENGFVFKDSFQEYHVAKNVIRDEIAGLFGRVHSLSFISSNRVPLTVYGTFYHPGTKRAAFGKTWEVVDTTYDAYVISDVRESSFSYYGKCKRVPILKEEYELSEIVTLPINFSYGQYDLVNVDIYAKNNSKWAAADVNLPGNKRMDDTKYVNNNYYVYFINSACGKPYDVVDEDEFFIYIDLFYFMGYGKLNENNIAGYHYNHLDFIGSSIGSSKLTYYSGYIGTNNKRLLFETYRKNSATPTLGGFVYKDEYKMFAYEFTGYGFNELTFYPSSSFLHYEVQSQEQRNGSSSRISLPPDSTCGPSSQCCLTIDRRSSSSGSESEFTNIVDYSIGQNVASVTDQLGQPVTYFTGFYVQYTINYTSSSSYSYSNYVNIDCWEPEVDYEYTSGSSNSDVSTGKAYDINPWGLQFDVFNAQFIAQPNAVSSVLLVNNQPYTGFSHIDSGLVKTIESLNYLHVPLVVYTETDSSVSSFSGESCSGGEGGSLTYCSGSSSYSSYLRRYADQGIFQSAYNYFIGVLNECCSQIYPVFYGNNNLRTSVVYEYDPVTKNLAMCLIQTPMVSGRNDTYYSNISEEDAYADALAFRPNMTVLFNSGVSEAAIVAFTFMVYAGRGNYYPYVFVKNVVAYKKQVKEEWDQRFSFPNATLVMVY